MTYVSDEKEQLAGFISSHSPEEIQRAEERIKCEDLLAEVENALPFKKTLQDSLDEAVVAYKQLKGTDENNEAN